MEAFKVINENSRKNLIPKDLSQRPDHKEISTKGGKAKSKAKTFQNQIKGMRMASPKKREEYYLNIIRDPELSAFELVLFSRELLNYCEQVEDKIKVLDLMIKIHIAIHGKKIRTENVHYPVDWKEVLENAEYKEIIMEETTRD